MNGKNSILKSCILILCLLLGTAATVFEAAPDAEFDADPLEGCKELEVAFTDLSDGNGAPITSWEWSFGDGGTTTTQHPVYTYKNEGNYTVSLKVTNADGDDTETRTDYIKVGPPTADFWASPIIGCNPLTVEFYNDTEGFFNLIFWDFGDGTISYKKNPIHEYTKPGIYTVSVTVWGCTEYNTRTRVGYITVYETVQSDFTVDATQVCVGEPVNFNDNSTNDPITWEWDFGDGTKGYDTDPSHAYDAPGTYTVSLYAENYNGCGTTIVKPDLVYVQETAYPEFDADPTTGCESITVNFTNNSYGDIYSYLWDFGDGTTSTAENPAPHTYGPGSYTVSLTTEGDPLCGYTSTTKEQYITVYEPLEAAFEADPTSTCLEMQEDLLVNFTSLSTGDIDSWRWDFGDGYTSTEENPSHTYTTPGKYTVSLTVTGPCGQDIETRTDYIQLLVPPWSYFSVNAYYGCPEDLFYFTNYSSGDITSWEWYFGDGTTSTEMHPTHSYEPGMYYPSLYVEGPCGSSTYWSEEPIIVYEAPVADFDVSTTSGCIGDTFEFMDYSTGDIDSWFWQFGDGDTSSEPSPIHTYDEPGSYTVSLTVEGFCGEDTLTRSHLIWVDYPLDIDFDAEPTTGCESIEVQFESILTSGTMISSILWDFGDNTISTERHPTHVFGPGTYHVSVWAENPCSADEEFKESFITVYENVTAMFEAEPTSGCLTIGQGFPVYFEDLSTGSITDWLWDFGDGYTSAQQNPIHSYTEGGVYTVSLTVSGPCGEDTMTMTNYITVLVPPTADFTFSPDYGCDEQEFQFTDLSTGDIDSWTWDFGDNTVSSMQNPSHAFGPGTHTVTLTVSGPCGEDTMTDYVTVYETPMADFDLNTYNACIGEHVHFTNYSTGDIDLWWWNFGDGETSTEEEPSHVYDEPGTYTVALHVSGICGEDAMELPNIIRVDYPLDVDIEAEPTTGCETLEVQFNTVLTSGTVIDNVLWEFGDGETSTEFNPVHVFGPGVYDVSLHASGVCGEDMEYRQGLIRVYRDVTAMFDAEPTSGCLGLEQQGFPVYFNDLSTGSIDSWYWDFGDGYTSTEQNPTHAYYEEGVYTVTLTVSGPCGEDTMTMTDYITVYAPPFADFEASQTWGCDSLTVDFSNYSGGSITNFYWDFGDGTTSTAEAPSHTFTPGTYTVSLKVEGPCGEDTEIREEYIMVQTSPTADFMGEPTRWCAPMEVYFTDFSTGDIDSWYWSFGDGQYSAEQNPTHTYDEPGTYTVSLMVYGPCGEDTETRQDYIVADYPLGADFDAEPRQGCDTLTVDFVDLSTGTVTSRVWDFGDNTSSTLKNPMHTYEHPGVYSVSLTVYGLCGEDTEYKGEFITIYESPNADFTADGTMGCDSLEVQFEDLSTGDIDSWWWDFGDGTQSYEREPSHTYMEPGTYTVTLNVSGPCGEDVEIKEFYIVVYETPEAYFSAYPTTGCETLTVDFMDLSTGDIDSWWWDFGDDSYSTYSEPVHTYESPGAYTVSLLVEGPCGESDYVMEELIHVYAAPQADFDYLRIGDECDEALIQFIDLSTGDELTTYTWDFGDGTFSHEQNPLHNYPEPGKYNITLTIEGICGIDSITRESEIVIYSSTPVADFHESPTSGCEPLAVQFYDDSTGVPRQWYWDFGDETVSRKQNPYHVYDQPGIYSVKLYVSNPCGSDILFRPLEVIVYAAADADFEADYTEGCGSLLSQFTSMSVEEEDSFLWDFGDGATSTERNPVHEYLEPGSYTVSLTVTTEHNCTETVVKEDYITVGVPIDPDFDASLKQGCAPLTVDFEDLSSGTVMSRLWEFGTGDTSTLKNPTYTYQEAGVYTVTLNLYGPCGDVTKTRNSFITVNGPPVADFDASPTQGCAPLRIDFTDLSQGAISSYIWDFGNGTGSMESDPSCIYNEPGVYTVKLMVEGPCGEDIEVREQLITVYEAPQADFEADLTEGCDSLTVQFSDISSGTVNSWIWDFGTGDGSEVMNPEYTYTEPGTYTVSLTVTGPCGSDTTVKEDYITIYKTVDADFTASPTVAYAGEEIYFQDHSAGDIESWRWSFGDGGCSFCETGMNPVHVYDEPGSYTVCLTVEGPCGTDTETKENYILILGKPWVEIIQPEGVQVGNIPIGYRLYDDASVPAHIMVEYSDNDGTTWTLATEGPGSEGISALETSPEGTLHTFRWNSLLDLGSGHFDMVRIMITPYNDEVTGHEDQTASFEVYNPSSGDVRRYILGLLEPPEGDKSFFDVNNDGIVNAADLVMLAGNNL